MIVVVAVVVEDVVGVIAWSAQRSPWGKEELTLFVVVAVDLVIAPAFGAGALEWPEGTGCQLSIRLVRPGHGSNC